jgi:Hsp20/alpha crystallin family
MPRITRTTTTSSGTNAATASPLLVAMSSSITKDHLYRQVGLPTEVKADQISANIEDGILTVTIPRAQRAQPTRIAVKTSVEPRKLVEAHAATV